MYPMILKPATKDYIWGGTRLKTKWHKESDSANIAECWELSCHKEGESIVVNGEYADKTLSEVLALNKDFAGKKCNKFKYFPVLIKLIDAQSNLSIQVHPSDDYAMKNEGQFGKSEMWYIADAQKGAGVFCGFKKVFNKDDVEEALHAGTIIEMLNFIEVKKGDSIFIPAGTIHAICGGLTICEVQQNSSLTYRLYDYNREDSNGKKRELHIDKALNVIDYSKVCKVNEEAKKIDDNLKLLSTCKYFTVSENKVNGVCTIAMDKDSFAAVTVVEGCGSLQYDEDEVDLKLGDTCFLPASDCIYMLKGKLTVIETRV